MTSVTFEAEPAPLSVDMGKAALVIIDMQRDFLEPGGFGEALGNDVSRLQAAVGPCKDVLGAARQLGMLVIHTREDTGPISPTRRRTRSCAAIRRPASARSARWAGFWCAASRVTTSSPSFIR